MTVTAEHVALVTAIGGVLAGIAGAATNFLLKLRQAAKEDRKDRIHLEDKIAEAVAAQLDGYRHREEELRQRVSELDNRVRELEAERGRLVDAHFKREEELWNTIRDLRATNEKLQAELDAAVLDIQNAKK